MTADLDTFRARHGFPSWEAVAAALGVTVRRIHRWRRNGIPAEDRRLVELAILGYERAAS